MLHIGCHLSNSKGYLAMGKEALRIGADTFAFFTRNPRGGNVKPLDVEDMKALVNLLEENHFSKLVAHAPYTYNLCSDKENTREFAHRSMKEDLERMEYLPGNYYNFHPGSHKDRHEKIGEGYIGLDAFRKIVNHPAFSGLPFILETPQESNDGYAEEIKLLRSFVSDP